MLRAHIYLMQKFIFLLIHFWTYTKLDLFKIIGQLKIQIHNITFGKIFKCAYYAPCIHYYYY